MCVGASRSFPPPLLTSHALCAPDKHQDLLKLPQMLIYESLDDTQEYSGTPLLRTPLGPGKTVRIIAVSRFQGVFLYRRCGSEQTTHAR